MLKKEAIQQTKLCISAIDSFFDQKDTLKITKTKKAIELKKELSKFLETENFIDLHQALHNYRASNIASLEGSSTYNNDVWDTSFSFDQKTTTLEETINRLEDIYREIHLKEAAQI